MSQCFGGWVEFSPGGSKGKQATMRCSKYLMLVLEGLEVLLMKLSRPLDLDQVSKGCRRCHSGMETHQRATVR